ncbi:helix-turn-helix transcriptional regulator [Vibrio natriegens]|uniref:helix-turn-helix transcriptional regulator n=1 Tax=Photobacterium ganghwense TaxID=320778 RepID=UPI003BCBB8C5
MLPPCRYIAQTQPISRFVPRADMQKLLGVSRSTLYLWVKSGYFPSPIKVNGNRIGWRAADFKHWLQHL